MDLAELERARGLAAEALETVSKRINLDRVELTKDPDLEKAEAGLRAMLEALTRRCNRDRHEAEVRGRR